MRSLLSRYWWIFVIGAVAIWIAVKHATASEPYRLRISLAANAATLLAPGQHIAFDADGEIWVTDGRSIKQLTHIGNSAFDVEASGPTFTPDGQRVAYVRGGDESSDLFAVDVSGDRFSKLTELGDVEASQPVWLSANVLVFAASLSTSALSRLPRRARAAAFKRYLSRPHGKQLLTLDMRTLRISALTTDERFDHSSPRVSPDHRFVAFTQTKAFGATARPIPNSILGPEDIWVFDVATRQTRRLTHGKTTLTELNWIAPSVLEVDGMRPGLRSNPHWIRFAIDAYTGRPRRRIVASEIATGARSPGGDKIAYESGEDILVASLNKFGIGPSHRLLSAVANRGGPGAHYGGNVSWGR